MEENIPRHSDVYTKPPQLKEGEKKMFRPGSSLISKNFLPWKSKLWNGDKLGTHYAWTRKTETLIKVPVGLLRSRESSSGNCNGRATFSFFIFINRFSCKGCPETRTEGISADQAQIRDADTFQKLQIYFRIFKKNFFKRKLI